jgi:K(+)-stimulated pyrophosphate-energized sodium pump
LLAASLAEKMAGQNATLTIVLAAAFFVVSVVFVWRSFYAMRIGGSHGAASGAAAGK